MPFGRKTEPPKKVDDLPQLKLSLTCPPEILRVSLFVVFDEFTHTFASFEPSARGLRLGRNGITAGEKGCEGAGAVCIPDRTADGSGG
jgi:hypothetical protein